VALNCPYMMYIDPTSNSYIKFDVKNSDGRSWSNTVSTTS
jgi:hypothetical protein